MIPLIAGIVEGAELAAGAIEGAELAAGAGIGAEAAAGAGIGAEAAAVGEVSAGVGEAGGIGSRMSRLFSSTKNLDPIKKGIGAYEAASIFGKDEHESKNPFSNYSKILEDNSYIEGEFRRVDKDLSANMNSSVSKAFGGGGGIGNVSEENSFRNNIPNAALENKSYIEGEYIKHSNETSLSSVEPVLQRIYEVLKGIKSDSETSVKELKLTSSEISKTHSSLSDFLQEFKTNNETAKEKDALTPENKKQEIPSIGKVLKDSTESLADTASPLLGGLLLNEFVNKDTSNSKNPHLSSGDDEHHGVIDDLSETMSNSIEEISNSIDGLEKSFNKIGEGIIESISSLTENLLDEIQSFAENTYEKAKEGVASSSKNMYNKVKSGISSFGEDVYETGKGAINSIQETGKEFADSAKGVYKDAVNYTSDNIIKPIMEEHGGKEIVEKIGNWSLGDTSKKFESGKSGAGTVSSGKGDHGGVSYGTYQMSSKQGVVQDFLKQTEYGKQFQGLQVGSEEFNTKWKEIAKNDEKFGEAQHSFIKKTHFDPLAKKLKKETGIDVSKMGAAAQDAVWSTSVQFGGGTELLTKALKGADPSKITDEEFVTKTQDYKIEHNDQLFSKSSDSVRAGTLKREKEEKAQLLGLARTPPKQEPTNLAKQETQNDKINLEPTNPETKKQEQTNLAKPEIQNDKVNLETKKQEPTNLATVVKKEQSTNLAKPEIQNDKINLASLETKKDKTNLLEAAKSSNKEFGTQILADSGKKQEIFSQQPTQQFANPQQVSAQQPQKSNKKPSFPTVVEVRNQHGPLIDIAKSEFIA